MEQRLIIEVVDSLDSDSITSALSANQGRVLKEMINKNIMTFKLGVNLLEESGGAYKTVPLTLHNNVGNKLLSSGNGIKIGEGVSKVLVSSNLKVIGNTLGNKHSRILKNGSTVCWANSTATKAGHELNVINTPILIDVQKDDVIELSYYVLTGDVVSGGSIPQTYLTVEVVE